MRVVSRVINAAWLFSAVALIPQAARATTLTGPACVSDTFNAYSQLSVGCHSGVLQLFSFDLFTLDTTGLHAASTGLLNTITVAPVWDSLAGSLQLTVGGFTPFHVDAANAAGYEIRFTVDLAPVIAGEAIAMDPPFGSVIGTHYFCMDDLFSAGTGLCTSGTPPGQASFGIGTPAYISFVPLLYLLDTRTDIQLNQNLDTPSGFDGVVYTFQTTSGTAPGRHHRTDRGRPRRPHPRSRQ